MSMNTKKNVAIVLLVVSMLLCFMAGLLKFWDKFSAR